MRVIAGRLRGRQLEAPPGTSTRPITDRVKETLFNILGARLGLPGTVPEVDVLDLFAGSGGLGLEALSRGARSCLFVEHNPGCVRVLRQNVARLGLEPVCRISTENAWTMRIPSPAAGGYGLAFLDPPYAEARDLLRVADVLERIAPHLSPDGLLIFRHQAGTRLPLDVLCSLKCVDERELGTMRLWLFAPAADRPPGEISGRA